MEYSEDKIDEVTLALMFLSLDEDGRAWKNFDWDAMNRLCEKGFLENPRNNNKSVLLAEEGIQECERLFRKNFGKQAAQCAVQRCTAPDGSIRCFG